MTGNEMKYIEQAVHSGKISGNGAFTKSVHRFFESTYGFRKCLLTTSCTDALEMAAILLNVGPGDEVIMPSFTFVSTANAFVLRGAKIVFADSQADHPNLDHTKLEDLITPKTKAIVVVHYAGMACEMDAIMAIAKRHDLYVVEDAAQAIDSFYKEQVLGGIGHLAAFSFHETKNLISGEGGMLVINDEQFRDRAEIIWEKGTNRAAFFRGEIDKYNWVDKGSSFLPSEIISAFLFAQVENLKSIQEKRIDLWNTYYDSLNGALSDLSIQLPNIPEYATNNAHMFYLVMQDLEQRNALIQYLSQRNVHSVFHYMPLHQSPFFKDKHDGRPLPQSVRYSDCIVRLPLFFDLNSSDFPQAQIIDAIQDWSRQ